MTLTKPQRLPLFAALAAAALVVEWLVAHSAMLSHTRLIPYAVLADLVLVLPLVFYALVLRPAKRPLLEAAPVATTGSLVAAVLLARAPHMGSVLLWVGIAAEVAVFALLWQKLSAAARRFKAAGGIDDPILRLEALPERWLRILGLELVVGYYALVGPRVCRTPTASEFSYTEKSGLGGLLFALGFVTVVEGLVVHFLLRQWHPAAGWVFSGLHAYTLLWLGAAYQAARLRPVVVTDNSLVFRYSLLWTAEIPRTQLASIAPLKAMPADKTVLRAAFGDDPKLLLTFTEPVTVKGLLGKQKQITQLALFVDAPERLLAALEN
jgi:hypothetical protein